MKKHKITFFPNRKSVTTDEGQTVLKAAGAHGIHINSTCGGKGTCGRCRVVLKEGEIKSKPTGLVSAKDQARGVRLACLAHPVSDLVIEIPLSSQMRRGGKIAVGSKLEELQKMVAKTCKEGVRPRTRKVYLKLPPPNLDDNISDVERIKRELIERGHESSEIHINLPIIQKIGRVVREMDWMVTVTLLRVGNVIEVMDVQPGDTTSPRFGAAVDIGTTSIVAYLVDLSDGKVVDVASTYNPQMRCGDDVISRIVYATESGGLGELQDLVIDSVNGIIGKMASRKKVQPESIDNIVIAGNTTMTHLFYGIDPVYIREEPYIPTATFLPLMRTKALGLNINDFGVLYAIPGVASYVGGDITSGVLASRLYKKHELSLFIDVGTNGEIVLGSSDWMVTAACSAGPAFEGGGVKFGMRAMEGAIEKVAIDPVTREAKLAVIDNVPPSGICGSGMIDAIAEMFLTGVIDQRGKLNMDLAEKGFRNLRQGEDGPEYVLAWAQNTSVGKDIALTEPDIDNIIRTKGAIYAGIRTLLGEVGLEVGDIEKIYIAGGFGNYIDVERAITIGLLPDLPVKKFEFLGNTSVMGAYMALLSKTMRKDVEEIARKMTYMELSVSHSFMDEYVSALFLPHTDGSAFPTVERMRKVAAERLSPG